MLKLTEGLKKRIISYSENSIYRLNAKSSDCYAFNIIRNNRGQLDFEGGFDWKNSLVDTEAEYLYIFDTKEFIKL